MAESGFVERPAESLAHLVAQATKLGTLEGWRTYIRDQQVRSGVSNQALAAAIEKNTRESTSK